MTLEPLTEDELRLMKSVFSRHPEVASVTLFGSRAKGMHNERSDVDLVVDGAVDPLQAEALAAELDDLPLPYRFEVQSWSHLSHPALREHIERVGIRLFERPRTGDGMARGGNETTLG